MRKAMGASTADIVRLLLWQFTRPVLWANLIAWPVAWLGDGLVAARLRLSRRPAALDFLAAAAAALSSPGPPFLPGLRSPAPSR